jgi:hypothetical protein
MRQIFHEQQNELKGTPPAAQDEIILLHQRLANQNRLNFAVKREIESTPL